MESNKFVDKGLLLDALWYALEDGERSLASYHDLEELVGEMEDAPVVKVREARWEINPDGYYPYCTWCKNEPKGGVMSKYCPDCGALMTHRAK